jgi:methylmalonyl-CoA carboxyltransferase small subunit
MRLSVTVNGIAYDVEVEVQDESPPTMPGPLLLGCGSAYGQAPTAAKAPANPSNGLAAPISGTVVRIGVSAGQRVEAGDTLMILEAMKMETEITAPAEGQVAAVTVAVGDAVSGGDVLLEWA